MARLSSFTEAKKKAWAAKIAAGDDTYATAAKKLGMSRSGVFDALSPMVNKLSGELKATAAKIEDAVDSIKSLPAPLKKNAVGFLETLIAAFDGDFAKYVANNAQISLHASKLAINRLAKAGANPSPEDLAHVAILTKIGKESASPILESARIMSERVRLKKPEEEAIKLTQEQYLEARRRAIDSV